ncbi:MAG: hypothetical protein HYZ28_14595 [Myxococcales bacterium]|nr:hypothetical protein [Myxococcales bacterium]
MSVLKIRELLRDLARDERLTLEEVKKLIDASTDEQAVTVGEKMLLEAALRAHERQLTPEAYAALEAFLKGRGR